MTKAMSFHGARYIHVHVPCPLGWGRPSHDTIRLARLAAESGFFPVFEAEHGVVTGSRKIRHRIPVDGIFEAAKALRSPVQERKRSRDRAAAGNRRPQHRRIRFAPTRG